MLSCDILYSTAPTLGPHSELVARVCELGSFEVGDHSFRGIP